MRDAKYIGINATVQLGAAFIGAITVAEKTENPVIILAICLAVAWSGIRDLKAAAILAREAKK